MKAQIKKLYEDANVLYKQAQDILKEHEGKELPNDKGTQVDRLLDQVEAKTNEAKRLERTLQIEGELNTPANRLPAPGDPTKTAGGSDDEAVKVQRAAYHKFLRYGPNALNGDEIKSMSEGGFQLQGTEAKALQADEGTAGGFLVANQFRAQLITKQKESSAMRRIANVLPPIPGGSSITPSQDSDLTDAEWTSEIATGNEDEVKPFGNRVLTPHPLAKRIKISNTLLRAASGTDVEAWVRDQLAYKFSVPEENGYINGNGAQKPVGLLTTVGLPVHATATTTEMHGDDIINWAYKLPSRYSPSAKILCNRAFIRKVRGLHTFANAQAASNYLWMPGLGPGQENKILDWPYELSDRFDDGLDGSDAWQANAVVAVIGDFRYYWIVDSLNLSIQRLVELYAEKNQTGFIGRKETDGMAVLPEAFFGLKIKA